ncbi:hypothetical protein ACOSQ4_004005 [Xanthoceras sorbifolium]
MISTILIIIIILLLIYVSSRNYDIVHANASDLSKEEDLIIEKNLQALNKPHVKTIVLQGGEIYDCIDFYKQPAFDHHLLKNHTIQMGSKSYITKSKKSSTCPIGRVPIRRTTKEDLLRARNLNNMNIGQQRWHIVCVIMKDLGENKYHGGSSKISVYNLSLSSSQESSASVWVSPLMYGSATRLFIYWTADGGQNTGCCNLHCPGFVQVDHEITPDHLIFPVSSYGGPIYDVTVKVFQDKKSKNWVLSVFEEDRIVGYLPKELFPHMKDGAKQVAWGGVAAAGSDGIAPPMGSGHKPDGVYTYNHAAYFKKFFYFDEDYVARTPSYNNTFDHLDDTNCFGFQQGRDYGTPWRYTFLFGGPGGQCGN